MKSNNLVKKYSILMTFHIRYMKHGTILLSAQLTFHLGEILKKLLQTYSF